IRDGHVTGVQTCALPIYIHFVRATVAARPEHFLSNLRSDPDVQGIEADTDVMFPEARPGLKVDQSTASILDMLRNRSVVPFYGRSEERRVGKECGGWV